MHNKNNTAYSPLAHNELNTSIKMEAITGSLTDSSSSPKMPWQRVTRAHKIHWRAPTIMIGSLLLGIILAIVQHALFQYYNRRIVSSTTEQVWISRVGTGLAFAVKALFISATGIAYIQMLMRAVQHQSTSVKELNAIYSILDNPWGFLSTHIWINHPILVVVSGITW